MVSFNMAPLERIFLNNCLSFWATLSTCADDEVILYGMIVVTAEHGVGPKDHQENPALDGST